MSITVARRPHHHVPWLPMLVVLGVVAAAVLIALLTVGSSQTTPASGTQAPGAGVAAQVPAEAAPAQPPLKYAHAPWATAGGSAALAAPIPAPAKYARAPWATGGGGSSSR